MLRHLKSFIFLVFNKDPKIWRERVGVCGNVHKEECSSSRHQAGRSDPTCPQNLWILGDESLLSSAQQQPGSFPWLGRQLLGSRLSWRGCKGDQSVFCFLPWMIVCVCFSVEICLFSDFEIFSLYSSILCFFTVQVSAFMWEKETVDVTCQWILSSSANILQIISFTYGLFHQ